MNVKKEELDVAFKQAEIENEKAQKVIEYLEQLAQEKQQEKGEKQEYREIGLVMSGEQYEGLPITERPIFFTKIEVEQDHNELPNKLKSAGAAYNTTKKGRKEPVVSFSDVLSRVSAKCFREEGVKMPHREPLLLIEVENENFVIPNNTNE